MYLYHLSTKIMIFLGWDQFGDAFKKKAKSFKKYFLFEFAYPSLYTKYKYSFNLNITIEIFVNKQFKKIRRENR